MAVPTGAGKSGVAELAIAQAAGRGWILYLAPTKTLVAQVQRDLRRGLRSTGIEIRGYAGGAEFVGTAEELDDVASKVLVMTPEKCSLALRQKPELFADLALCVFDECHELGSRGSRGVLAELVTAQVLSLAPEVRVLLLSALMANPQDMSTWLQTATGIAATPISEPWRPTRTLRAVLGFEPEAVKGATRTAEEHLQSRPNQKQRGFDAPAALLAGLAGAWHRDDQIDYALVRTSLTAPLTLRREAEPDEFRVIGDGYTNPTVAKLADRLAREEHRVLVFIPGSRHWSFSVASKVDLSDLGRTPLPPDALAQLDLADAELGLESAVRDLLNRGVGVHTSATLQAERRATELSFEGGSVRILFATGGLAQGLNLPATAVVIGGTEVGGYDPTLTAAQRAERTATQMLNAIGRAGRPAVAARSLAVVVPGSAVAFESPDLASDARAEVPFLASEDAAITITSRLDALIDRALQADQRATDMGVEELAAFAVLPQRGADEIIRRSFGAWERNVDSEASARAIATALTGLGERMLGEEPGWLGDAAYLAGLTVAQTLALHEAYIQTRPAETPSQPSEWVQVALTAAASMPNAMAAGILDPDAFGATRIAELYSRNQRERAAAWSTFGQVAQAWMDGDTYEQLAVLSVGPGAAGDTRRHAQARLPK